MSRTEGAGLRLRILVVDDNEGVRESTADILEAAGYEAIQAVDRAHAVGKLQHDGIDLMVVDLGVDRSGLRLLDVAERLPVVIATSGADEPVSDPRITVFLSKPVSPDRLLEEIARCLGR